MTRIAPPLLGYNNNVRYLGRTFHIQTEDSGTKYARLMTHLFIDGGHIVKSTRTEYGSVIGQPDMAETVRRMMKEQHKNMFLSLRAGEFDELIERVVSGGQTAPPVEATMSQVPRLRPDPLPSLSFVAGEEGKTLPGMSTLVIDSTAAPPLSTPTPEAIGTSPSKIVEPPIAMPQKKSVAPTRESARMKSARPDATEQVPSEYRPSNPMSASAGLLAAESSRQSGRQRRVKKSLPPTSPPRGHAADEPISPDTRDTPGSIVVDRSSEQSSRALPVRPATGIPEVIDPRNQSIFGEATAGRQTLDEVILSFLEDEES